MTEALAARFAFLGFEVDERQRRLRGPDGATIPLRPRVFDTLMVLVRRAGETVSKEELLAAVWQDAVVEENNLTQAISSLRQALADDRRSPTFVATIPGRGYQFIAPVTVLLPADGGSGEAAAPTAGHAEPPSGVLPRGWDGRRRLATTIALGIAAATALGLLLREETPRPPIQLAGARLATTLPAVHRAPALSPDGTLLAYVSDRSGVDQIWIRGLPDGTPVQLTHGEHPAGAPSWSPVDQNILFERIAEDGRPAVWLVDALGSNAPRIVQRGAGQPRFAPDGRSYVFVPDGLRSEIHLGFLDGTPTRRIRLPETAGFAAPMPAINARGDVAFVLAEEGPSGNLWVYDAEEQTSRRLTESRNGFAGVWARSPLWLPDQQTVIYAASAGDPSNSHLYSIDVDTGRAVQLSTGPGGYGDPAVSGNGERLAYAHARSIWRLVRTDPSTGRERVLHASRSSIALPTVSPDGRTVAFFGEHIYTVEVDGGDLVQWTAEAPGIATLPAWSRSDGSLFYYRKRALHRFARPGPSELVLDNFHWSSKTWLAVHGDRLAYRERLFPPGRARTVIADLSTGEKITVNPPLAPTDWSRDGRHLLARVLPGADLVICTAPAFQCRPILHEGRPVQGARPRWSADEQRVFFRRMRHDKPGYAWIWAVDRDGGEPERLVELGPSEPDDGVFFGVADDDSLIWNQYEPSGSEIWVLDTASAASAP